MADQTAAKMAAECTRLASLSAVPEVAARLEEWATQLSAEAAAAAAAAPAPAPAAPAVVVKSESKPVPKKRPLVTLKQYAWDQAGDNIKIYITINGVHEEGAEVELVVDGPSVEMIARNAGGKDHRLALRLAGALNADKCTHKVKNNRLILTLRKEASEKWEHLTESDKLAAAAKKPKLGKGDDESSDPSDSIMSMMRDMYQNGDDEMRRVIGKAWTESREKKL